MPKQSKKTTPKKLAKNKPKVTKESAKVVLPGYRAFSRLVFRHLLDHRNVFGRVLLLAVSALVLIAGVSNYSVYSDLSQMTGNLSGGGSGGFLETVLEVTALYLLVMTGTLNGSVSESQQIFLGLTYLMVWLVVVWLLRQLRAGADVKMRDGLYSAGAPLLTVVLILLFGVLQLLPFALIVSLIAALSSAGILSGLFAIIGTVITIMVFVATLYWLSTTLFALNVATIPGTYPLIALRTAKELISGYRVVVLRRILWLGLVLIVASLIIVPFILLDAVLGYALTLPVVLLITVWGVMLFIYSSSYIYLLYRGIIDERAN